MSSNVKKVEEMRSFFERRAATYDGHMAALELEEFYAAVAKPIAESYDALAFLDLGAGTGRELAEVFKKVPKAKVTAIDLSAGMLAVLRDKYQQFSSQLDLIAGSYLEVPFGECHFDYALSVMSLHHFLHDTKVNLYQKIRKALKPGGLYIEGDYMVTAQKEVELLERYHEIMRQLKERGDTNLYHIDIPFAVTTQQQLLARAGFRHVEVCWHKREATVLVAEA